MPRTLTIPPNLVGVLGFFLLINVLLTGCFEVQSSPRLEHLSRLFIHETDLPPGWQKTNESEEFLHQDLATGVISRFAFFAQSSGSPLNWAFVLHTLVGYPNPGQAAQDYAEIADEQFPAGEWIWPEQIAFVSTADQFRFACILDIEAMDGETGEAIEGAHHCRLVGQYGAVISIIYVNGCENQSFTSEDLQRLLEAVDARLANQSSLAP